MQTIHHSHRPDSRSHAYLTQGVLGLKMQRCVAMVEEAGYVRDWSARLIKVLVSYIIVLHFPS
jgi:hypothetical protein